MTGWARVAALLIVAHVLAPYLTLIVATGITLFVLTLAVLAWLLVTGRGMWAPAWRSRAAGTGGAQ